MFCHMHCICFDIGLHLHTCVPLVGADLDCTFIVPDMNILYKSELQHHELFVRDVLFGTPLDTLNHNFYTYIWFCHEHEQCHLCSECWGSLKTSHFPSFFKTIKWKTQTFVWRVALQPWILEIKILIPDLWTQPTNWCSESNISRFSTSPWNQPTNQGIEKSMSQKSIMSPWNQPTNHEF